jgi:hypothetical protein
LHPLVWIIAFANILVAAELRAESAHNLCALADIRMTDASEARPLGSQLNIALRYAEEFLEMPAIRLTQLNRYCRCGDGEISSVESIACMRAYQSHAISEASTRSTSARPASLPVQLDQVQLRKMQIAIESHLRIARKVFQLIASSPRQITGADLLREVGLPPSAFAADAKSLLEAIFVAGERHAMIPSAADLRHYPFFAGTHAADWHSTFDDWSAEHFAVWPLSSRMMPNHLKLPKRQSEMIDVIAAAARDWTGSEGEVVHLLMADAPANVHSAGEVQAEQIQSVSIRDIRQSADGTLYYTSDGGSELKRINAIVTQASDDEVLQIGMTLSSRSRPMFQQFVDNERLGMAMGQKLSPAVWYDYVMDQSGKVIGVRKTPDDQPLLKGGAFACGSDCEADKEIDFNQALTARKVFLPNLGMAAIRHPVVTHALNRMGAYAACTNDGLDPRACAQKLTPLGLSSLTPSHLLRVDMIKREGHQERFDFGQLPFAVREQAIFGIKNEMASNHLVIVRRRPRLLVSQDIADAGNGDPMLVDRVTVLRYFATFDHAGDAATIDDGIIANMAPMYSDDVGYGTPGAVSRPVEVLQLWPPHSMVSSDAQR